MSDRTSTTTGSDGGSGPGQRDLDASALKAYTHPLRLQIMRYLADRGTATATELARYLGESTGQTSYHLRQLARHGLVEDDPGRGTGRERWWKATSFSIDADRMARDPATAPAARLLMNAVVQNRTDALNRWLDQEAPEEWARVALHSESTLRLTTAELEELNGEVRAVLDRYVERSREREEGARPEGAERVRVYYDAFPLLTGPEPGPG